MTKDTAEERLENKAQEYSNRCYYNHSMGDDPSVHYKVGYKEGLEVLRGGLKEIEEMLSDIKEHDENIYNPEDSKYTLWHDKLHKKLKGLINNLNE